MSSSIVMSVVGSRLSAAVQSLPPAASASAPSTHARAVHPVDAVEDDFHRHGGVGAVVSDASEVDCCWRSWTELDCRANTGGRDARAPLQRVSDRRDDRSTPASPARTARPASQLPPLTCRFFALVSAASVLDGPVDRRERRCHSLPSAACRPRPQGRQLRADDALSPTKHNEEQQEKK